MSIEIQIGKYADKIARYEQAYHHCRERVRTIGRGNAGYHRACRERDHALARLNQSRYMHDMYRKARRVVILGVAA